MLICKTKKIAIASNWNGLLLEARLNERAMLHLTVLWPDESQICCFDMTADTAGRLERTYVRLRDSIGHSVRMHHDGALSATIQIGTNKDVSFHFTVKGADGSESIHAIFTSQRQIEPLFELLREGVRIAAMVPLPADLCFGL